MNKTKSIIISVFFLLLLSGTALFTSCSEPNFPDYVRNVHYVKLNNNSSYAVICWDEFENAEEYIVYRGTEPKGGNIKEFARTNNTCYGYSPDEYFYVSSLYYYSVAAVVGGKTTYCSTFTAYDESVTYEELR